MNAKLWPSIPAVLRVMAGWFLLGIGVLNLAVSADGGLTDTFLIFHLVLVAGGVLLLMRRRLIPSRPGIVVGAVLTLAAMVATAIPTTTRCCMAEYPARHGFPYPFLGIDGGVHVDVKYLVADLVFWACAGLLALAVIALVEALLPERRTPVDLTRYGGHAEPRVRDTAEDRTGENVGGLT
ncbi:hypothetical protein FHR83_004939 [Actinoplanes campanulatus]|uniref:Uncharacterized protein n=1 Tax=Actinoplanes campanulatus TaxID=113559 RepID=A0A7W5AJW9_9ACTN|nr:hypothetical protein [Actinoplanes campanulatus]MBB3097264.1 hypothetical protein [Actinoplanes campanulatus]GGN16866.1 hypothetical protein GCM10010109_29240 [Actinoplanes campanulatus]GID37552.1 hypothetical protein Aca09nite_40580 [Actinoplanes campanulatus]